MKRILLAGIAVVLLGVGIVFGMNRSHTKKKNIERVTIDPDTNWVVCHYKQRKALQIKSLDLFLSGGKCYHFSEQEWFTSNGIATKEVRAHKLCTVDGVVTKEAHMVNGRSNIYICDFKNRNIYKEAR